LEGCVSSKTRSSTAYSGTEVPRCTNYDQSSQRTPSGLNKNTSGIKTTKSNDEFLAEIAKAPASAV
jgi:hypothetical protein